MRFLIVLLMAAVLHAQDNPDRRSFGYAFGGPLFVPTSGFTRWDGTFIHAGGGGEAAIGRYVSAGAEAGVLAPVSNQYAVTGGTLSAGISVHPLTSGNRADAFVSGGVGGLVARGAGGLIYLGGGVNYWLRERFGIRFEVRHHVWPGGDGTIHLAGVRFGVVFR